MQTIVGHGRLPIRFGQDEFFAKHRDQRGLSSLCCAFAPALAEAVDAIPWDLRFAPGSPTHPIETAIYGSI